LEREAIEKEAKKIKLSNGDIVIDIIGGNIGLLLSCENRESMKFENHVFWEIIWYGPLEKRTNFAFYRFIEEKHLQTSIILGILRWQSIEGVQNEYMERIQDL